MKKRLLNLIVITLTFTTIVTLGQVSPVGSSNTSAPPDLGYTSQLIVYKNEVYFGGDYVNGNELLKVNSNDNLIYQFKDINSGYRNSSPDNFFVSSVTNELFFAANGSNTHFNKELWKSDGTVSGTIEAADFNNSISKGTFPNNIAEVNNKLIMSVESLNQGVEVGVYNTTTGNKSIIDVYNLGNGSHSNPEDFYNFNGKIYFSAFTNIHKRELYATDGTASGTQMIKDINTNSSSVGSSDPKHFTAFNNKVYFSAKNGVDGNELWVTDGTTAGTNLVKDINTNGSSNPENFLVFGNRLYFTATSDSNGTELYYMSSNESVVQYKDINPGAASSNPSDLFVFKGKLYFSADNGTNGEELWRADGSIFGIGLFKDINTSGNSSPKFPIVYNDKMYFVADDGATGRELWATDGTSAGTTLVADINSTGSSEPISFVVANELLFFHADNGFKRRLWMYQDPVLSTKNFDKNNVQLYPNPIKNSFKLNHINDIKSLSIFDITGKKVKIFDTNQIEYNISELSKGIYFLEIEGENSYEKVKIIKE